MNLNGDYISDALAAQVGGIGIAPGANIGDECALFEATHGTAPKYAGQDKVNPGSIILSAEMMFNIICGWIIWTHWSWSILPVHQILNGLLLRQFRPDDIRRGAGICCRHRVNVIQHSVKPGGFWLRQLPPGL